MRDNFRMISENDHDNNLIITAGKIKHRQEYENGRDYEIDFNIF